MNNFIDLKKKTLEIFDVANINDTLEPQPDITSIEGFTYPRLAKIYGELKDLTFFMLRELEEAELLIGEHYERILICPFCHAYNICFRDQCPTCSSTQISIIPMIHHFSCGYMGYESEFVKQNGALVCPKCSHSLIHIGKDYEKPSEVFRCEDCEWSGSEPITMGLCLACIKEIEPEKCIVSNIKKYRLSPKGRLAVQTNNIEEVITHANTNSQNADVENSSYVRNKTEDFIEEIAALAYRNKNQLGIMAIIPDELMSLGRAKRKNLAESFTKALIEKIKSVISDTSRVIWIGDSCVAVIIYTHQRKQAEKIADQIINEIEKTSFSGQLPKSTMSTGLLFWDYEEPVDELLEKAVSLAESAFEGATSKLAKND